MAGSSWIETKRDADLDESGKPVVKKVQLEPAGFTGKYRVDLILRIIGMIAIITPIVLVYLQQRASLNTQKAIKQLEVYSEAASQLGSICRRPITSAAFTASKEVLLYDLPPKIAFLFTSEVSSEMDTINELIPIYEAVSHNSLIIDSLFIHGNDLGSSIGSYAGEAKPHYEDADIMAAHLTTLDSCRRELVFWSKTLETLNESSQLADSTIKKLIRQMIIIDIELLQFATNYAGSLSSADEVLRTPGKSPVSIDNRELFARVQLQRRQLQEMRSGIIASSKSIKQNIQHILETTIKRMQTNMRKANYVFQ